MKTITVAVDERVLARLDLLADGKALERADRSSLIRSAIEAYVSRLEREAEEIREREIYRQRRLQLESEARALVSHQAQA